MPVKAKLTLTVDDEVIPRAKRHASAMGVSLSEMVEAALRQMTGPSADRPFGTRWKGRLAATPKDSPRYKALARRYL